MRRNSLVVILLIIFCIAIAIWGLAAKDRKITQYLGDYDYTIGKVEQHYATKSITYVYSVKGIAYKNKYSSSDYHDYVEGSVDIYGSYAVVYNKNYPEHSIILGDFPLITETQLENFKTTYRYGRPK